MAVTETEDRNRAGVSRGLVGYMKARESRSMLKPVETPSRRSNGRSAAVICHDKDSHWHLRRTVSTMDCWNTSNSAPASHGEGQCGNAAVPRRQRFRIFFGGSGQWLVRYGSTGPLAQPGDSLLRWAGLAPLAQYYQYKNPRILNLSIANLHQTRRASAATVEPG
jgi:hypothetical protein